jgi:hypothetical protein
MSAYRRILPILVAGLFPAGAVAQKPLDHDAYDRWRTIEQETLSRDGAWVSYVLQPQQGDGELVARATGTSTEYRVLRGRDARFAPGGTHLVFVIKPEYAAVRAAKVAKKRADDMPRDSLGILDLATGEIVRVERLKSFRVPERGGSYVAYLLEREPEKKEEAKKAEGDTAAAPADTTGPKPKKDSEVGSPLVLRHLASGTERRYDDVTEYVFARDGGRLAAVVASRTGETDGVVFVELAGEPADRKVSAGRGTYQGLAFAEQGDQLAYLSTRDEAQAEHPRYALYRWRSGDREAHRVARVGTAGVPDGWTVSEHRAPSFSRSGGRLYFGTVPWEAPPPEDSTPDDERVRVDVWHWQDAELQPMQLRRVTQERRRNYLAVAHLDRGRVVQLADRRPGVPDPRFVGHAGVAGCVRGGPGHRPAEAGAQRDAGARAALGRRRVCLVVGLRAAGRGHVRPADGHDGHGHGRHSPSARRRGARQPHGGLALRGGWLDGRRP